jgi:hypothetical protein
MGKEYSEPYRRMILAMYDLAKAEKSTKKYFSPYRIFWHGEKNLWEDEEDDPIHDEICGHLERAVKEEFPQRVIVDVGGSMKNLRVYRPNRAKIEQFFGKDL